MQGSFWSHCWTYPGGTLTGYSRWALGHYGFGTPISGRGRAGARVAWSESAIRVDQPDPCFIGTVEVVFTREEYAVDQTFKDSCSMEEQSRK